MAEDYLPPVPVFRKSGNESFRFQGHDLPDRLLEFWQWSSSDLVGNALRGVLAEYIVAMAVGATEGTRTEWDAFDILTPHGVKIEIKSAAYLQSWSQKRHSAIQFDIRPTQGWNAATNEYSTDVRRQADVYVFCVLSHKDKETVDPLDLDQWDFYVVPTTVLDAVVPRQKTISLSRLQALNPNRIKFGDLREVIENVAQTRDVRDFKRILINGHEFLVGPPDDQDQVVVLCKDEDHLAPAFDRIGGVDYVGGEFPYRTRMNKERVRLGQELEGKWKQGY